MKNSLLWPLLMSRDTFWSQIVFDEYDDRKEK